MSDFINSATGRVFDSNCKSWKRTAVKKIQAVYRPMMLYFASLTSSIAEWKDLKKKINIESDYLENLLFFNGMCVLFKFGSGYCILPCVNESEPDVMGRIVKVRPYPWNSSKLAREQDGLDFILHVQDEYDSKGILIAKQDAVLIRNNSYFMPTWLYIEPYINQIMYTMQSKNIHQVTSRVKWLLQGDKNSVKGFKAQMDRVLSNDDPYAVVDVGMNADMLSDISGGQDTTYSPEPYWYDIDKTLNFILTQLGLDNHQNIQKRERESVAEVEKGDTNTQTSAWIWKSTRENAVYEIKKIFGIDLEFSWGYNEDTESEDDKDDKGRKESNDDERKSKYEKDGE